MKAPEWIFWALVAGLFIFEAWALRSPAQGDTISEIIWRLSNRPLIPFALGFLMGHFFFVKPG